MPGAVDWSGPMPTLWETPQAENVSAQRHSRDPMMIGRADNDDCDSFDRADAPAALSARARPPGACTHEEAGLAVYQLIHAETRFLHWEIFETQCYSAGGWVKLNDGDVVVDCGANIGLFTLWATSQADLAAVVAVEPMRAQFECLRRNIDLHSLKQTVRPRQLAVGSVVEEDSAFVFFPKMPSSSHRASRAAEKEGQREAMSSFRFEGATSALCRTTTLSNLISEERLPAVHLLKIDVEGDELEVLQGLGEGDWPLVRQVVMEAHDVDGRVEAIRSLLTRHGFEVRIGGGDARMERNGCFGIAARRIGSPSTVSRRQRGGHVATCSEFN